MKFTIEVPIVGVARLQVDYHDINTSEELNDAIRQGDVEPILSEGDILFFHPVMDDIRNISLVEYDIPEAMEIY